MDHFERTIKIRIGDILEKFCPINVISDCRARLTRSQLLLAQKMDNETLEDWLLDRFFDDGAAGSTKG